MQGFKRHSKLHSWENIEQHFRRSEILIGNGASCAVWDKFRYSSLYQQALSNSNHPLSDSDIQLFTDWDANGNFEKVLANLLITKKTNTILGEPNNSIIQQIIRERYNNVRNALVEAVQKVHVEWSDVSPNIFNSIQEALSKYSCVYSTNYDLLIYWSIMSNKTPFRDYFWNGQQRFDITDIEIRGNPTRVLYLHGALHLYRQEGRTRKLGNSSDGNILNQFESLWDIENDVTPVFIAEGSSREKLESIYKSDYLSFAYSEFQKHKDSLVVFGHSLGESDQHLINAMKTANINKIAISMRQLDEVLIAKLHRDFPYSELFFFNAQSHPLGDPSLKV
jgi:hypothetical protein